MSFYQIKQNGISLTLRIIPNSSKNEITELTEDYVKIKVTAPPNENKANKAVIEFISDYLKIPKTNISIIKGNTSKNKIIFIENIKEDIFKQKFYVCDNISDRRN